MQTYVKFTTYKRLKYIKKKKKSAISNLKMDMVYGTIYNLNDILI